jgi:epoxyqueuosine reductase
MVTKNEIITQARELGFEDIGFTSADPFFSQKEILLERKADYQWILDSGLDLVSGTDPRQIFPTAQTIIVLIESYFREAFPPELERHFGRCYLDDDRITKNRLALRIKAFREFLGKDGIASKIPFHLPHRLAAARAGLGTFGKNCLFYSRMVAGRGSWVLPIAFVVDRGFVPDSPTLEVGCPDWCKNTCLVACPTGALKGPRRIEPRRCISYLTYYGRGITPLDLREPMGLWVYGCDRCQNVCPRNAPWLARTLPQNQKVAAMAGDFRLPALLHMDRAYFNARIRPHMFYMGEKDIWRWKMNAARAMGNSLDAGYIPDLIKAFGENDDERVRGMIAWSLGRIGGPQAKSALADFLSLSEGQVLEEIQNAIDGC